MKDEAKAVLAQFAEVQPLLVALGDERRQSVIVLLLKAQAPRSVGEITVELRLSQPAVSHHLKILRDARLLTVERRGVQRLYSLNPECAKLLMPLRELIDRITECAESVE